MNGRANPGTNDGSSGGLAAVVVVVVLLAGGAAGWMFVLDPGGDLAQRVQAGAAVSANASNATDDPGTVTVTWTSNPPPSDGGLLDDSEPRHADRLQVRWSLAGGADAAATPQAGGAMRVVNGTTRLDAVGQSVTLAERNATTTTRVEVLVVAGRDDVTTVIVAETVVL